MPAEIAAITGDEMMAYLGETPWHRLGTKMEGRPDVAAALKAAKLNWDIALEPMFLASGKQVPAKRAVVRVRDNAILSTVSADYTVIQNSEAFGVLSEACDKFGLVIETAGALGKGDRVWMSARMDQTIEPVAGDKINGYVLITAGHNGWTAHAGRLTTTRVVCQNTFNAATKQNAPFMKLRHTTKDAGRVDEMATMVTQFTAALIEQGGTFASLANKKFTFEEMHAYIESVLGMTGDDSAQLDAKRDRILELTEHGVGAEFAPGTAWAAFNAFTEFIDHDRAGLKAASRLRAADQSAVFGPGAKLKARALEFAVAA